MRNLNQAYAGLNILGYRIGNFLRISDHYNYNDLSNFDIDHLDAQQLFLKAEMRTIMDRLAEAQERILYLARLIRRSAVYIRTHPADMRQRRDIISAAGALWIPHDEMAERYGEIPEGCPVILHCDADVVSDPAYETLTEKRPDIPEISYIDGAPPIKECNEWLEGQQDR